MSLKMVIGSPLTCSGDADIGVSRCCLNEVISRGFVWPPITLAIPKSSNFGSPSRFTRMLFGIKSLGEPDCFLFNKASNGDPVDVLHHKVRPAVIHRPRVHQSRNVWMIEAS